MAEEEGLKENTGKLPQEKKDTPVQDSQKELPDGVTPRDFLAKLAGKESSLIGKELPADWPKIISSDEELKAYHVLYASGEITDKPPTYPPVDKLSYTIKQREKELRYMAVQHIFGQENRNHRQFAALKENFDAQKPQIVLYEGPQGNPATMSEEDAYLFGEKAYMQYLVLNHNSHLQPGEEPIQMESCDLQPEDEPAEYRKKGFSNEEIAANEVLRWMYYEYQGIMNTPTLNDQEKAQKIKDLQKEFSDNPTGRINPEFFSWVPRSDGHAWDADVIRSEIEKQTGEPLNVELNHLELPRFKQMFDVSREFRDQFIVKRIAETAKKYDKVMAVMGSSHVVRERPALEQFYDAKSEEIGS